MLQFSVPCLLCFDQQAVSVQRLPITAIRRPRVFAIGEESVANLIGASAQEIRVQAAVARLVAIEDASPTGAPLLALQALEEVGFPLIAPVPAELPGSITKKAISFLGEIVLVGEFGENECIGIDFVCHVLGIRIARGVSGVPRVRRFDAREAKNLGAWLSLA